MNDSSSTGIGTVGDAGEAIDSPACRMTFRSRLWSLLSQYPTPFIQVRPRPLFHSSTSVASSFWDNLCFFGGEGVENDAESEEERGCDDAAKQVRNRWLWLTLKYVRDRDPAAAGSDELLSAAEVSKSSSSSYVSGALT